MPEPLPVTVVIPAYNRPDMVARAVRSALGQRPRPPAEVIVVDDCSSDGTGDAASAAGATVIRHDVNRGEAAARNTVIRAAGEEWIALLDSDDEFLPGHLAALLPHRNGHVILGSSGISYARDPADDGLVGRARETSQLLRSPADLLHGVNALDDERAPFGNPWEVDHEHRLLPDLAGLPVDEADRDGQRPGGEVLLDTPPPTLRDERVKGPGPAGSTNAHDEFPTTQSSSGSAASLHGCRDPVFVEQQLHVSTISPARTAVS